VESGARKIVVFDGGAVTEGEVRDAVQRLNAASTATAGGTSTGDIKPGSPQFEAAKRQVVPQLLAFNLAKAYARENGIEVSEDEVQGEIDQTKQQVAQQAEEAGRGGDSEEIFQDALGKFGFTEASFRQEIRTSLLVRKVQEDVAGDAKPTEEEVRDFYEKNKATQFTMPERRCLRHILFTPDEEKKAESVKSELENGGDFAKLAEDNSQDPGSKDKGGDLGCQAQGAFVPEFDKAAFGAKEGEIVGPVKTDFGYHLIEVTKIQPEEEIPLEEATPEIEQRLSQQRQATEFGGWVQDQLEERNAKYLPGYDPSEARQSPGAPGAAPPEEVPPEEAAPQGEQENSEE
jgi:parvulin-like peptidyl-prolyl isomerase